MSLVDEIFHRIVFDQEDRDWHFSLYAKVKKIADDIEDKCGDSEEKMLAFRALHLALMHVGSSLAKHEKYREQK